MKLENVDVREVGVRTTFQIQCSPCGERFNLDTASQMFINNGNVGNFLEIAARQGWRRVETDDEVTACACPKCIAEIQQNELEVNS
jgi:hypothetical protein